MSTEKEMLVVQKSTVYDIRRIFETDPNKSYSLDEIRKILDAYIAGAESQITKNN